MVIKNLTPDDIDEKFNALEISPENSGKVSELKEKIKGLVEKNIIDQNFFNITDLTTLCNRKKYTEFLQRRNKFLQEHQVMDADEFAKLFGNKNLQNKKITNHKELVSGKYNKADINQGKLGICVFDTFLKQLKETPFFETLIRCSLQRNEEKNGWKCLIPFCNNEGKYEEISDSDIDYLKNSKHEGKELLSNSSLGFNIMETILIKMIGNKKKYPRLSLGHEIFQIQGKVIPYDNLQMLTPYELYGNAHSVDDYYAYKYFLGEDVKKQGYSVSNFTDNEAEWLINLTKTGIIKLRTGVMDSKINKYIRTNIPNLGNEIPVNNEAHEDSNEKILNERGYPLKILHEAGPNEDISIGRAEKLGATFKIKGTKERFIQSHAYSIEGMHKKDGETFVTIINPRYTGKKIDVPLKYIKEFFSISIYGFDLDKLFVEKQKDKKIN